VSGGKVGVYFVKPLLPARRPDPGIGTRLLGLHMVPCPGDQRPGEAGRCFRCSSPVTANDHFPATFGDAASRSYGFGEVLNSKSVRLLLLPGQGTASEKLPADPESRGERHWG